MASCKHTVPCRGAWRHISTSHHPCLPARTGVLNTALPRCQSSGNATETAATSRSHGVSRRRFLAVGAVSTATVVAGVLAAAGAGAVMAAGILPGLGLPGGGRPDPRALTRSGMDKFRRNDVEGSVADFDAVIAAAPSMRPYMWQRGLSLYYLGRFAEGAEQFRVDVAVNPNDTEESIWTFLCEAQIVGAEQARKQFLEVGRDPRPVMRTAYECFRTGQHPDTIMAHVADNGGHDTFYGLLYVGLWHEAHGDAAAAQRAVTAAAATPYARLSGDYMAALARVHCALRGWQVDPPAAA